jgi:hypothetical protein
MSPRKVSAQFTAYSWFSQWKDKAAATAEAEAEAEALRFARENWPAFLPCAPEGLGRLLIRLAHGRRQPHHEKRTDAGQRRMPTR